MHRGEPGERLGDQPRFHGAVRLVIGEGLRQHVCHDLADPHRPTPPGVDRQVARRREQPRPHRTPVGVQSLRMSPGPQQRLLHEILRALTVPVGQPQGMGVESVAVLREHRT